MITRAGQGRAGLGWAGQGQLDSKNTLLSVDCGVPPPRRIRDLRDVLRDEGEASPPQPLFDSLCGMACAYIHGHSKVKDMLMFSPCGHIKMCVCVRVCVCVVSHMFA